MRLDCCVLGDSGILRIADDAGDTVDAFGIDANTGAVVGDGRFAVRRSGLPRGGFIFC